VTKFLVILIAPVVGVLLLFAVFAAFVWVAMKVAGPYSETIARARARSRRGRGDEDEWAGSPVIKYIKALTSQFPSMEDFSADRQAYGRMLSYFPYLMLVVICLFLFTGVAVEDNKVNLTVMVTGMALALLSATSTLLYVTYIIQPRWRAAAESYQSQKPTDGFFFRYVRLNAEFFALLALLVVALLSAAFLPAVFPKDAPKGISYFEDGQYKHMAWGMVTIFMLLASFGLSYGVIQKGIFENVRELLRKHKAFQNCVERYSYPPLIEDMLGELKPGDGPGIEDTLATFLERLDSLEESSLNYELSQIFSPEEAALVASKARQWRWVPRWVRRLMRRLMVKERVEADEARVPPEIEPLMSLRPIDYLDSEEAVEKYEVSEIELADVLQFSKSLTEKIADLQKSLASLDIEIKSLLSDIEAKKTELAGVEERKVVTMSEVNSNFRQDEVGFKKAFRIGQQFKLSQQLNRGPVEG
jgi:predicted transcriptional regulator